MAPARDIETHWSLDKRVPLALIATMVAQLVFVGVWLGQQTSKLASLEERIAKIEMSADRREAEAKDISTRIVRLEERTGVILDTLRDIKQILDRRRAEFIERFPTTPTGTP